jgi:hypothetical protein
MSDHELARMAFRLAFFLLMFGYRLKGAITLKTSLFAASLVALSSISALASSVTFNDLATFQSESTNLTFEGFETALSNGVVLQGVTYSSTETLSASPFARTGATAATASDSGGDVTDIISASFGAGVTALGGFVSNEGFNNSSFSLSVFNAADVLLATVSVANPTTYMFLGVTTMEDIARAEWTVDVLGDTGASNFDDFALDDVYFGQALAPIPLPASVLLLGGAIAGFGLMRRRNA